MAKTQDSYHYLRELRNKVNQLRQAGKLPKNWSCIIATELNELEKYQDIPITPDQVIQAAHGRSSNEDLLNKLIELSVRTNLPAKIELCNMVLGINYQASR